MALINIYKIKVCKDEEIRLGKEIDRLLDAQSNLYKNLFVPNADKAKRNVMNVLENRLLNEGFIIHAIDEMSFRADYNGEEIIVFTNENSKNIRVSYKNGKDVLIEIWYSSQLDKQEYTQPLDSNKLYLEQKIDRLKFELAALEDSIRALKKSDIYYHIRKDNEDNFMLKPICSKEISNLFLGLFG